VIAPNGGEVLFVGAPTTISWTATDDVGVTSVDIYVSRDNGATYELIAAGVPNTGNYNWVVTPPASNTDATVVYESFVRIVAHDAGGNTGQDESDAAFAIFDLATPTLVLKFEAEPLSGGVALRWQTSMREVFASIAVERAEHVSGPFSRVDVEQEERNGVFTLVDRSAASGVTYFYRLLGTTQDGQVLTFGPLEADRGRGDPRVRPHVRVAEPDPGPRAHRVHGAAGIAGASQHRGRAGPRGREARGRHLASGPVPGGLERADRCGTGAGGSLFRPLRRGRKGHHPQAGA